MLLPGVTESSAAAMAFRKSFDFQPDGAVNLAENQLSDAFTGIQQIGFAAEIGQQDFDFPPVVAVYRTGRVQHSDAVVQRQTAAGPHLSFPSFGQSDGDAGGNGLGSTGIQSQRFIQISPQIQTGRVRCGGLR